MKHEVLYDFSLMHCTYALLHFCLKSSMYDLSYSVGSSVLPCAKQERLGLENQKW